MAFLVEYDQYCTKNGMRKKEAEKLLSLNEKWGINSPIINHQMSFGENAVF